MYTTSEVITDYDATAATSAALINKTESAAEEMAASYHESEDA